MTAEAPGAAVGFWQIHFAHVALLAVWVVVFGLMYVRSRSRLSISDDGGLRNHTRTVWTWLAAAGSLVGAGVHLAVTHEHFRESALYGVFFLALTVLQVAWAGWLLVRPSAALFFAGAAASALVVLLWIATRTAGIPVGPGAGGVEPVGGLDVLASAAETAVVVAACAQAWGARLFAPVWHTLEAGELV